MGKRFIFFMTFFSLVPFLPQLGAQTGYQKPPKVVQELLDAPPTPGLSVNPTRTHLVLLQGEKYPPIADLARPMLGVAGLRLDPRNSGPHLSGRTMKMTLVNLVDGRQLALPLPPHPTGAISWSPRGDRFAFMNTTTDSVELWIGESASATTRRIDGVSLSAGLGQPMHWLGADQLICQTIVTDRGPLPKPPMVPPGPVIQESIGKASPVRTFQDLLKNPHDEQLFDYHTTAELWLLDLNTGQRKVLGKPGIFSQVLPSPDGKKLFVERIQRPYSYQVPEEVFPRQREVWDLDLQRIVVISTRPLADQVPIEGVPTGPRHYHWRPTEPATLVWVEALDGGDPRKPADYRDRVLMLRAPFQETPTEIARTQHRFAGLSWLEGGQLGLLNDYERSRRWLRTFLFQPEQDPKATLIWDRSIHDHYRDPGDPVFRTLPSGHRVVRHQQGQIFLIGQGATPQGDRPYLDIFDLKNLQSKRLFQSAAESYEMPVALLSEDGSKFLTRRESPTEPPNYFLHDGGRPRALTSFPDPTPQLRGIKKQLVTYKRPDGVPLSMTLYVPANYQPGQRLPAVLWAYPREFVDAGTAGQVVGSTQRFTTFSGPTHLFFLTQGYAVLDGATMPVIGPPDKANNTYIEQIVASAKAAIDKAEDLGVIDRQRVGVGGHSYGAFMTANLLAHSDLFRAGIARSGAYNRTLTPFGFQSEPRTLWQASEVYLKMSPFLHAQHIKAPLLLIHGAADNNSGTFPVQSERMFQALRGHGAVARYVSLPYEAHGYMARESVEHTLFEMITWFDQHVKNAGGKPTPSQ